MQRLRFFRGVVETLKKIVGELEGENNDVRQSLKTTDGLLLKTQERLNIALRDKQMFNEALDVEKMKSRVLSENLAKLESDLEEQKALLQETRMENCPIAEGK